MQHTDAQYIFRLYFTMPLLSYHQGIHSTILCKGSYYKKMLECNNNNNDDDSRMTPFKALPSFGLSNTVSTQRLPIYWSCSSLRHEHFILKYISNEGMALLHRVCTMLPKVEARQEASLTPPPAAHAYFFT